VKGGTVLGLGVSAIVVGLAASVMMVGAPPAVVVLAPLAFLFLDGGLALVARLPGPSVQVRTFARLVAAAAGAIALRIVTSLASAARVGPIAAWLLPATAILVALGWTFGAVGGTLVRRPTASNPSNPSSAKQEKPRRPALVDGTLVLLADVVATGLAFGVALMSFEAPPRSRFVATLALATILLARSVAVAFVTVRVEAKPTSGVRAAIAFVLWLGIAGFAISVARSFVVWSGAGAALVLTLAAVMRESRRPAPSAVSALGRATFAWCVAALLAILALLSLSTSP
jgi:hypothetical protein